MNFQEPTVGAIFYYFEDPSAIRAKLIDTISNWINLWQDQPGRVSTNGTHFRSYPSTKKTIDWISQKIKNHDFARSLHFTLSNSTSLDLPSQQLVFWGATLDPKYPLQLPNYFFVQLPPTVCIETFRRTFWFSQDNLPAYLALGNMMAICDQSGGPKAGSSACRFLRQSNYFLHDLDTTFRNPSYQVAIQKKSPQFLVHPSQFIGFRNELCEEPLGSNKTKIEAECGYTIKRDNKHTRIELLNTTGLSHAQQFLAPHFCKTERPPMYWKEDEWRQWIAQMQTPHCREIHPQAILKELNEK